MKTLIILSKDQYIMPYNLYTLSTEAISTQYDSKLPDKLIGYFTEIQSLIEFKKIRNGLKVFKDKDIDKVLKKISKEIKSEMGIDTKHVYANTIYAVLPLRFDKASALAEDNKYIVDYMRDHVDACDASGDCSSDMNSDDIKTADTFSESSSIMNKTLKTSRELIQSMSKKDLVVDFKNANINGLKQDDPLFIMTDFVFLFNTLKLKPANIVGVMFHELGHVFTHIASMYRDVKQTTVLLESLTNDLKNKSVSDVIKMRAISSTDESTYAKEPNVAIVNMLTEELKRSNENNVLAATDSEQMADQFATRFGLGAEVVEGLDILGTYFKSVRTQIMISTNIILATYALVIGLLLTPVAGISFILSALLGRFIGSSIIELIMGSTDSRQTTYDKDKDRYRRIRDDLVRQLRTGSIPKNYISKALSDITYIDTIISKTDNDGFIERIGNYMPWNINDFKMSQLQRLLEETSENKVHVSKNKLEQLI